MSAPVFADASTEDTCCREQREFRAKKPKSLGGERRNKCNAYLLNYEPNWVDFHIDMSVVKQKNLWARLSSKLF